MQPARPLALPSAGELQLRTTPCEALSSPSDMTLSRHLSCCPRAPPPRWLPHLVLVYYSVCFPSHSGDAGRSSGANQEDTVSVSLQPPGRSTQPWESSGLGLLCAHFRNPHSAGSTRPGAQSRGRLPPTSGTPCSSGLSQHHAPLV